MSRHFGVPSRKYDADLREAVALGFLIVCALSFAVLVGAGVYLACELLQPAGGL